MPLSYSAKLENARSNANPVAFNFTCAAGVRLLVLTLVIDGATPRAGGAPTYNSVAMTQADATRQAVISPETTVEMWYSIDPGTGSAYSISIPNTGSVYISAEATSFKTYDAGNVPALRAADYAQNTSTNPTGPTHTGLAFGDLIIAVVGYGDDSFSGSGGNATLLQGRDEGTYGWAVSYSIYAGGDAFIKWTDTTNEDWVIVSAVFKEAAVVTNTEISKAVAYSVLTVPVGVNISKAVAYAVLQESATVQTICFVVT